MCRALVYGAHHGDLGIALGDVGLVDTEGINPEVLPGRPAVAGVEVNGAESIVKVLASGMGGESPKTDEVGGCRGSPDIAEGDIRGAAVEFEGLESDGVRRCLVEVQMC